MRAPATCPFALGARSLPGLALTVRWAGPLLRRGWTLKRAGPYYAGPPRSTARLTPVGTSSSDPLLGAALIRLGARPCRRPATFALGTWSPYAGPYGARGRVRTTFAPGLGPVAGRPSLRGAATLNGSSVPHGRELIRPILGRESRLIRLGARARQRQATFALGTGSPYAGPYGTRDRVRAAFAPGLDPVAGRPLLRGASTLQRLVRLRLRRFCG